MSYITFSLVLCVIFTGTSCFESLHRHRHSRSHPLDRSLDRLLNRLDAQTPSPTKVTGTTPEPTEEDVFDNLDEEEEKSMSEPHNSLWGEDSAKDASALPPLGIDNWEKKFQEKMKKDKHSDIEETLDKKSEDLDEDDEEAQDDDLNEQADSYRHWSSKNGDSFTDWKFDNLGNQKGVDRLFQLYKSPGPYRSDSTNKELTPQYEIYWHTKQMSKETLCRWPKPKVVRVSDVYPGTSKRYVPSCTVIHQCGDDTGCCGGTAQRCGPKTTKRVELYFYTTYIVSSHNRQHTSSNLEKLPFYNHTECECVDRLDEVMPRDGGPQAEYKNDRSLEPPGCKCPSEFTVRRLANGSCSCDCFDKQRDCIKYKRGKEYFNHQDRLCIEVGTCQQPSCDFGVYLRSSGRCPRKHEKFRSWSRFH